MVASETGSAPYLGSGTESDIREFVRHEETGFEMRKRLIIVLGTVVATSGLATLLPTASYASNAEPQSLTARAGGKPSVYLWVDPWDGADQYLAVSGTRRYVQYAWLDPSHGRVSCFWGRRDRTYAEGTVISGTTDGQVTGVDPSFHTWIGWNRRKAVVGESGSSFTFSHARNRRVIRKAQAAFRLCQTVLSSADN